MKIFVVIPAFNEGRIIAETIANVKNYYSDIIVVDDGSTDDTFDRAKPAGAKVLRHIINRGQGAALRTGINYALENGAEIIVTFDADGQFEAGEIEKMCQPIINGDCEVVLGTRFAGGNRIPLKKSLLLKAATILTEIITGMELTDVHNGFRALSRQAALNIIIRQDRMAHASDIIHEIARLKLKFKEIPVTVKYTDYSKTKGQKISGSLKILFDMIFK